MADLNVDVSGWYSKYKDAGVYNKHDQKSTKAIKTRKYIKQQDKVGREVTNRRLDNARKQREGYGKESSEQDIANTRQKVKKAFDDAYQGRFRKGK